MNPKFILFPMLAQFVLTLVVLLTLAVTRLTLIRSGKIDPHYFKVFQGAPQLPERAVAVTRNFANLFEMPVLFYVITVLLYVTARLNNADVPDFAVTVAWIYVGLRALHTLVHLTFNHVPVRFALYVISNLALMMLWFIFYMDYYL